MIAGYRERLLAKGLANWGSVLDGESLKRLVDAKLRFFVRTVVFGAITWIGVIVAVVIQALDVLTGPWAYFFFLTIVTVPLLRMLAAFRAVRSTAASVVGLPASEARRIDVTDPDAFLRSVERIRRRMAD